MTPRINYYPLNMPIELVSWRDLRAAGNQFPHNLFATHFEIVTLLLPFGLKLARRDNPNPPADGSRNAHDRLAARKRGRSSEWGTRIERPELERERLTITASLVL